MHSSSASIRTILPLAFVTGVSMAAMDLYLPAVPALQASLGISVPLAQATVAVYLAGLAGAQLLWGELLNRLGPRLCMEVGLVLLALTSLGCALAPNIETLLVMRLLQGVAAAAPPSWRPASCGPRWRRPTSCAASRPSRWSRPSCRRRGRSSAR